MSTQPETTPTPESGPTLAEQTHIAAGGDVDVIAIAPDPARMARAFRLGVAAGREAYETGLGARGVTATATSPLTGFLHSAA